MADTSTHDLRTLLAAWHFENLEHIRRLGGGSNNTTFDVAAAGKRYVLRIYPPAVRSEQIRFEHDLLTKLGEASMSFTVAAPIESSAGDTLVAEPDGGMAALFPFIPGEEAHDLDLTQTRALGGALGELDEALSAIHLGGASGRMPAFGNLRTLHPDVPDPLEIPGQVPLPADQQDRLREILLRLLDITPTLYATLPRQIVHRDFDGSNALMEDGAITGIIDFEFAALDLRACELAAPLMQFSRQARETLPDWKPIRAFAEGHREWVNLSAEEIRAVPDLTRLWRAGTLVHREGRRRRGQADMADVVARARGLLRIDAWLARESDFLVEAIGS